MISLPKTSLQTDDLTNVLSAPYEQLIVLRVTPNVQNFNNICTAVVFGLQRKGAMAHCLKINGSTGIQEVDNAIFQAGWVSLRIIANERGMNMGQTWDESWFA